MSYLVPFFFSIAITSLGEEKANLSDFRMFDRFVLVLICRFPLPLDVLEGLRLVILALPGLFSYLFYYLRIIYLTLFDYLTILLIFYGPGCNILIISSVLQNKNNGTAS